MADSVLKVGSVEVRVLDDGIFITDAGNLFGPKAMRARARWAAIVAPG